MRVELILPVAKLHGKLNGKAPYYFKTINDKTYVQRCPKRTTQLTPKQIAARERFAAIAQKDTAGGKTRPSRRTSGKFVVMPMTLNINFPWGPRQF